MATFKHKILVTGANGFIGHVVCFDLLAQGYEVVAAIRRKSENITEGCQSVIVGDIDDKTEWVSALEGVIAVVHLAARVHIMNDSALDLLGEFRKVNIEATLNLARQSADAGVRRFLYISSIGVNGAQSKNPFTEYDAPHPHNAYALSKLEAELGLQEISLNTGMEYVIIRPPLVYGAGAPGNFSSLIKAIQKRVYLPLGSIHNKRSFIYVGNLVSIIIRCIEHPAAANQVFLVSDGQDLSTTELLQACAAALGVKARLLPVPQKLLQLGAALLGRSDVAQRLCGNLQVDISKARTILGWKPAFTVEEGLKVTAAGLKDMKK